MASRLRRWKKPAVRLIKLAVGLLVVVMVLRSLARTWDDLRAYGAHLRPRPEWLVVSGVLYLVGLACYGLFFWRIMHAGATPVRLLPALRAYLIGHLGKYVPGKALVVVMRVGLVTPHGARAATAAFATLYETLVMMATGGVLAGVLFFVWPGRPIVMPMVGGRAWSVPLAWLATAVGLPLLVMAEARIFPILAMTASLPFPGVGREALPRFSHRLLAEGVLWSVLGWVLLGLSLAATIAAIEPGGLPVGAWPAAIAASALATVAGFLVAIFPGGLVIREAVLAAALGPTLGAEPALVAALVLRLVWVAAELLAAAVLAPSRGRPAVGATEGTAARSATPPDTGRAEASPMGQRPS